MTRKYDPHNDAHRAELASALRGMLRQAGFSRGQDPNTEEIWGRLTSNPHFYVVVYSTIWGDQVRAKDTDAIRVFAKYDRERDDKEIVIVKERPVHRVGTVEDIVKRTLERMRTAWIAGRVAPKCAHCGAPKFTSSNGNIVCAEACWTETHDGDER